MDFPFGWVSLFNLSKKLNRRVCIQSRIFLDQDIVSDDVNGSGKIEARAAGISRDFFANSFFNPSVSRLNIMSRMNPIHEADGLIMWKSLLKFFVFGQPFPLLLFVSLAGYNSRLFVGNSTSLTPLSHSRNSVGNQKNRLNVGNDIFDVKVSMVL